MSVACFPVHRPDDSELDSIIFGGIPAPKTGQDGIG